ncbi:unnamed protein product [Clavelina lepadiformis]|uniref:Thiamine transporter 2 n=1 Tax=Clavelina lepadiformis TaxID=159417 RepID=A0ABP0H709_CLALP
MENWKKPTVIICLYGFFLYIKPSEPFLTPYLMGPVHNLTEEEVVNEIYPVWIYSYLALLVPVFLLTDYLKYKPIIILQALGQMSCWILLLFGRGVSLMRLMQVFYAFGTSGEVAYYSYIYSVVEEKHYQLVTSYIRSATLLGYFLASLLSQLLVSLADLSYYYLNVISLVNVSIAFVIALFLPMPKRTLFFYASNNASSESRQKMLEKEVSKGNGTSFSNSSIPDLPTMGSEKTSGSWKTTLVTLGKDLKDCYTDTTLLRWSVWWALSTCGWLLVVNYVQNLWETIRPSEDHEIYNGAVETVATVLGALGALAVGYIKVNWVKWGEFSLGFISLVICVLLMAMYWTTDIWICYVAYVLFISLYNIVITITQLV